MDVNGNVVHVVISEDGVPNLWVQNLSIVHNEPGIGCISLNELSGLSIEILENLNDWLILWLVDWLESVEGTVASPSLKKVLVDFEAPVDAGVVDVIVFPGGNVPVSIPV